MAEEQVIKDWKEDFELSDDDKKTLSKYDSALSALQGGAATIRMSGSPERIIKGFTNLKMDELEDKQKDTIHKHIRKIQGVPDSPAGYNIQRPEVMPLGMEYDVGLEEWFRNTIHAGGGSNALVNHLVNEYNKRQFKIHDENEAKATEVENKMKEEMGGDGFEAAFGKEGDPNKIGRCKTGLLMASKELGLDYTKDGLPQSYLLDALELNRKGGRIGDKAPLLKYALWVYDKFLAEGSTGGGTAPKGHLTTDEERKKKNKEDFSGSPWMYE